MGYRRAELSALLFFYNTIHIKVITLRILFLEWDSFGNEYIASAFEKAGCTIEYFSWPYGSEQMRENEVLEKTLSDYIGSRNYHFVFSFNFFPVAAKACYQRGTTYVSWIYDSPFMLLYSKHADYITNQIYIFDKSICRECWNRGMQNVYYLPMAAPVEFYDKLGNKSQCDKKYRSDISFVGSTYQEKRNDFYSYLKESDSYTVGYLDALMNAQRDIYGTFILEDCLSEEVLDKLKTICPMKKEDDEWETDAWIYANYFLARKVSGNERTELIKLLAEEHELKLYTTENNLKVGKAINCGTVDYIEEMPLVFKNSKINLNITLRSIHSGIPLRAMDIMGCGGFLMTNFQEDFLEYFEPGIDYVYYESDEDLLEKVNYYLSHDEERNRIAQSGYEKVAAAHTYQHRVETILANVMSQKEKELNDSIIELEDIRNKQGGCWYQLKIDWQQMSDSVLVQNTDKQMEWLSREKEKSFYLHDRFVELIDEALESGNEADYEKISILFNKNVIDSLYIAFPDIFYVYIFVQLYRMEKEKNIDYTIKRYTSHKQLMDVCRQITFYLRRLECDIEKEYKGELFRYIQAENLSPTAVMLILECNSCMEAGRIREKMQMLMKDGMI